jgi:hypothetical protein
LVGLANVVLLHARFGSGMQGNDRGYFPGGVDLNALPAV